MPMTAQQALKRLQREGWLIVRQSGSHIQLVKDGARITLPMHRGDLSPGVERNIRQKAGWETSR